MGWHSYVEPLDEVLVLFTGINKNNQKLNEGYDKIREKYFVNKTITDEINEYGKYKSRILFPFGENKYNSLDEMLSIIKDECNKSGKRYIYAYDNEPDYTMHELGSDNDEVRALIRYRSQKIEDLSNELEDTVVFIIADHGHIKVDNIYLNDYPDLINMLDRTTLLEQRAVSFKVKNGMNKDFENKFIELFGKYFSLYTIEDVINSKLFGDGDENLLFRSALGDYIAIAENSNKALIMDGDDVLFSQHAGYTDDEIYVPIIMIDKS